MYNPKIEELINAALADGVLTEKEKQVLYKKAASMGIDLDEFEMVLQSRLYDKQQGIESGKAESSASPQSKKMGDIKKCPACGAIISNYQATCPECGYEFSDVKANLSSQLLADKLEGARDIVKKLKFKNDADRRRDDALEEEQVRIITTFPVPTTKADLLEFITSLMPRAFNSDTDPDLRIAYENKLKECVNKAELHFKDDPMFKPLIEKVKATEKQYSDKEKKTEKKTTIFIIGTFVLVMAIVGIGTYIEKVGPDYEGDAKDRFSEVTEYLEDGNATEAEQVLIGYSGPDEYVSGAYEAVVNYYLNEGNYKKALALANSFDYYSVNAMVYKALIKAGLYDDAKTFIDKKMSADYSGLELETYIGDVVNDMCEKGEKEQAVRFVKKEVLELPDYDEDVLMRRKNFEQDMLRVINEY